jgi:hypothetical protein
MMNPRRPSNHPGAAAWRRDLRSLPGTREPQAKRVTRVLCGWTLCLLLLGWGSVAPASALVTISSDTKIKTTINDSINVVGTAHLTIAAGASIAGNVFAYDSSAVTVTGGSIGGALRGFGSSTLSVSGGSIGFPTAFLSTDFSSTATVYGGSIHFLVAAGSGPANVYGGSFDAIYSQENSTINVYGGSSGTMQPQQTSTINLFGCNLLLANPGVNQYGLPTYDLTGTLQDGTVLDEVVSTFGGSFQLHESSCSSTVQWSGVLPPINAGGSSVFKLGSTVPVIFQLTGASAGITNLQATLSVTKISDSVVGTAAKAVSTSAATTGNLFRYDATSGDYIFNWSTKGLTAGTYQLSINLGDGLLHTVIVSLR